MKPTISLLIASIAILVAISCKSSKEVVRSQEQTAVSIDKNMVEATAPAISFTIDTAWISNLVLNVVVSYTGPKKGVEFKLIFDGAWLKMNPPKAIVFLEPICSKPNGNVKVKQSMSFDISPLKASNSEFSLLLRDYKQSFDIE